MTQPLILVPTDGSETADAAIRLAIELAAAGGERIVFISAWRELCGDFGIPLHPLMPELLDAEREWASDTLAAAAAKAAAAGVEAETISRHGVPADKICEVARERQVRMIVIGSHGWGSVGGALFGSVSNAVLKRAPCPVLIVPSPMADERSERAPIGAEKTPST